MKKYLDHLVVTHSKSLTTVPLEVWEAAIMTEIQRLGWGRWSALYGVVDRDFVDYCIKSNNSGDTANPLMRFKVRLWEKILSLTSRLWHNFLKELHPNLFKSVVTYWEVNYNNLYTLQIEHVSNRSIKFLQMLLPKQKNMDDDIFMVMAMEQQQNEDQEMVFQNAINRIQDNGSSNIVNLTKAPKFMELLRDCHKLGISIPDVWKIMQEQADLQSKYMLELLKVIPCIPSELWGLLGPPEGLALFQNLLKEVQHLKTKIEQIQVDQQQAFVNIQENQRLIMDAMQRRSPNQQSI